MLVTVVPLPNFLLSNLSLSPSLPPSSLQLTFSPCEGAYRYIFWLPSLKVTQSAIHHTCKEVLARSTPKALIQAPPFCDAHLMQWDCETPDSTQPSLYKPLPITCSWTTVIMIELSFLEKNLPMLSPGPSPTRLTSPLPSLSIWHCVPVLGSFSFQPGPSGQQPSHEALVIRNYVHGHSPALHQTPPCLSFLPQEKILTGCSGPSFLGITNPWLSWAQSPQGFYLLLVSFLRPKEQDTWGSRNGKSPLSYNSIRLDLHRLIQGLVYRICGPHWHWQNSYNPVSFHIDLAVNSFLGATFSTPNLVPNLESLNDPRMGYMGSLKVWNYMKNVWTSL